MKAFLIGSLAIVVATPAYGGVLQNSAPRTKFGSSVQLNYTAMRGGGGGFHGGGGGFRGGYHGGYRGGYYRGGYYGRYGWRYPYYGYGYGWGYPYAAAFAFGFGLPLAYYAGYYSAYPAYYPYYGYYGGGYYGGYAAPAYSYRVSRSGSSGRRSSSGNSLVSNVQSSLKSRGYYAGGVDGNFGPESHQALLAFQNATGLPPTGSLDTPSLSALGIAIKQPSSTQAAAKPTTAPTRTPTTEGTFVAPPVAAPITPPPIQSEPAPSEPAPAATETSTLPPPTQ